MRFRFLLIVMLLFGNFARAQFQAQEGWGKPRLITSLSATGGLILDAKNDLVLALEETGLSQINLKTASKTVLIQKRGLKELRGLSSEWGMVGAWGQRSLSSDDSLQIFWLKNGKLEIETATTNGIPSAKTVLASAAALGGPKRVTAPRTARTASGCSDATVDAQRSMKSLPYHFRMLVTLRLSPDTCSP